MGWPAIVALSLLGALVLLFAVIGFLFVTRGTPVSRVRSPDGDGPPGAEEATFCRTVELLTKTAILPGHEVEVMTCGDELYPRLWADLRAARRSITLQLYYCQPGRMAEEFAEIITERARAGVPVLFLRDAFGSKPLPDEYWERLKAAGVRVAVFRPTRWWELHKIPQRSHIRVVVVDGHLGYTGGFGIDDKWYGDGRHEGQWRDTTARFTGPAVRQLQATFAAGWAEATGDLLTGDHFFALEEAAEESRADRGGAPATESVAAGDGDEAVACAEAGVLHASPTIGSTSAERFMALTIASARRELYISNSYFVPDDDFRALLVHAARRGVDVRLLTPGPNSDVKSTYYAGRAHMRELLAAGVRVFEYHASMMHAKTIVADGVWSTIGTMNFDNRSMAFNDESVLMVHDRAVAERMNAIFRDDLTYAPAVTLEAFDRRPWTERVLEWGASALSRIL
jgi:cardiolipin synthase A/B